MRRFYLVLFDLCAILALVSMLWFPVIAVAAEVSPALAAVLQSAGLGWLVQYLVAAVAIASILDAVIPQPVAGSHWLPIRKLLSFAAANVGFARNSTQPDIGTWIARVLKPLVDAQIARQEPPPAIKTASPQPQAETAIASAASTPAGATQTAPAPPAPS